jgi:hypothetical protein
VSRALKRMVIMRLALACPFTERYARSGSKAPPRRTTPTGCVKAEGGDPGPKSRRVAWKTPFGLDGRDTILRPGETPRALLHRPPLPGGGRSGAPITQVRSGIV